MPGNGSGAGSNGDAGSGPDGGPGGGTGGSAPGAGSGSGSSGSTGGSGGGTAPGSGTGGTSGGGTSGGGTSGGGASGGGTSGGGTSGGGTSGGGTSGGGTSGGGTSGGGTSDGGTSGGGTSGGGTSGGGTSGGGAAPGNTTLRYAPIPATDAEAARFLSQATFGVTREEIQRLRQVGYEKWIDDQLNPAVTRPTRLLDYFLHHESVNGVDRFGFSNRERAQHWLWSAAKNPDQLRMRIGLALSEILVVAEIGSRGNTEVFRNTDYQDLLVASVDGSFRDLLEKVAIHPAMGSFLSHAGNRKADPSSNVTPDENFAREIMQLFSIGLVQLNLDGTPKLDANGQTIPTYDQEVITNMARVFTGWTYQGVRRFGDRDLKGHLPMVCYPEYHDDKPKVVFNGLVINEGNDCRKSLAKVIDALAAHPNTAPFISRQLIQRFVTSNPSPAYVRRVVDVWHATNGNIGKVVKAILLDNEARIPPPASDPVFGKAREPLIVATLLHRSFKAQYEFPASKRYNWDYWGAGEMEGHIGQESLRAPTVFNWFEPGYRLPGSNGAEGILAPEFQILNEATYLTALNMYNTLLGYANTGEGYVVQPRPGPTMNLAALVTPLAAGNYGAAVDEIGLLMMDGRMSARTRQTMIKMATELTEQRREPPLNVARALVILALASPEFMIQR